MSNKKIKAIFQIILIICTTFTIYLLNAKEADALALGCCEKIGDKYCQPPSQTNTCDPSKSFAPNVLSCADTTFCKLGTCYIGNSCSSNVPKALCSSLEGQWFDKPITQIPECRKGCCITGTNCNLVTKSDCQTKSPKDFEMIFKESVTDEISCTYECTKLDKGCCIIAGECTYTTREACTNLDGQFNLNQYCSSLSSCSQCRKHDHKGCIEPSEDLYWYDSCNNPEELAENCNFPEKKCAEDLDNKGKFSCRDLSCKDVWDNPFTSGDEKEERINGESWCEYQSAVGPGKDLPGTIHYRHSCLDGVESAYPSTQYRDQICFYSVIKDPVTGVEMSTSSFKPNRWEDCIEQNNQAACENDDVRDCVWLGKYCVPQFPPAFRFWEGEGSEYCRQANLVTQVLWEKKPGEGWEVKKNEQALKSKFLIAGNTLCRTMGDCGASYNGNCQYSNLGYQRNCGKTYGESCDKTLGASQFGDCNKLKQAGIGVYLQEVQNYLADLMKGKFSLEFAVALGAFGVSLASTIGITSYIGWTVAPALGVSSGAGAFGASLYSLSAYVPFWGQGIFSGTSALSSAFSSFSVFAAAIPYITAALAIISLMILIYQVLTEQKITDVTTSCKLWQAPPGGKDCWKCSAPMSKNGLLPDKNGNIIEGYLCTEYLCNSLGQACQFVEDAADGPACVVKYPKDTNWPIIRSYPNSMKVECFSGNCNVEDKGATGFKIGGEIKENTVIRLAINTIDENSNQDLTQCKYSTELGKTFDEMDLFFSEGKFAYQHELNLYNLEDGKTYNYFVRCSDINGNANPLDYTITFTIHKAPDITPPQVEFYDPLPESYIASSIAEKEVEITINEAVEDCKWSTVQQGYEAMTEKMICIDPSETEQQTCEAILKPINLGENLFYFACKDTSGNVNVDSYPANRYKLIGTSPLEISSFDAVSDDCTKQGDEFKCFTYNVTLKVQTSNGAENGLASCKYSNICESDGCMIDYFFNTNANMHTQIQYLDTGFYTYYALCEDTAGNTATASLRLSNEMDATAPKLIGVSKDEVYGLKLKVIIEDQNKVRCEYSDKEFFLDQGTGIEMTNVDNAFYAPWELNGKLMGTYYVRCEDKFGNEMPMAIVYTSGIK